MIKCSPLWAQPMLSYLPEMTPLPDSFQWGFKACSLTNEQESSLRSYASFVYEGISSQRVRQLSRWAIEEMEDYQLAIRSDLLLSQVWCDGKQKRVDLVLDDHLPSHHPRVRRQLMVMLLGPTHEKRILINEILYTIRGDRLE